MGPRVVGASTSCLTCLVEALSISSCQNMGPRVVGASTSCLTCRNRKVKCNRSLPICSACERLGLQCNQSKAASRLSWIEAKGSDEHVLAEPETSTRRKALYSDVERKADCARMSTQVNSQPIDILLHSLDGTEVFATDPEGTHCLGPFGVFSIQPSIMPVIASDPSDSLSGISPDALDENRTNPIDISSFENGVEMLTEQQDLESDLFGNGLLTSTFDSGVLNSLFELTGCTPEEQPLQEDNETSTNANPHMQLLDLYLPFNSTPSLQFAGDFGDLASSTTNTLLVHYKENLISCFMSVEHHKPPWQILHLPCAVSAYGEIVSLGDTNHAKASLLFAIFAMSALNLDRLHRDTGKPSQWRAAGELYRDRAKLRLQACLREQGSSVKKAKYKEVLMAMLSMVTTCVVTGQMEEARCFLLDAERFIYLRGLPKIRKSPKVLMLHAIFLYLRVVEESTYISAQAIQPSLPNSFHDESNRNRSLLCRYPSLWTERLKLSLSLNFRDTTNLEMQLMAFPADIDEPTVFENIYGIPESLFRSISHATYLANELGRNDNVPNKQLDQSIKALERQICDWKNPYRTMAKLGPSKTPVELEARCGLLFDFIEAIHSALMIYFYRRVRDVNSVVLQHYVHKTIHHLLQHEKKKMESGDMSASFCWPGFIAACEALDPEQRDLISAWFQRSGKSSGLGMFDTARDVTMKLWAARGATGNSDMSWEEILANGRTALILS